MGLDLLLDFIAKPESNNNIDAIWGGIKSADYPSRPVSKMTIGEVLDWQDSIDRKYMSEASGGWQFMEDTLRGLYQSAGLSRNSPFNESNQRKLATELLRRRGLDAYLRGDISEEKFGQGLSKEWASLPCLTVDKNGRPAQGQSYYAGDGLNKSHVSRDLLLAAIRSARSTSPQKEKDSFMQSSTLRLGGVATVGTLTSALSTLGGLDPTAQIVILGISGVVVLSVLWMCRERIKRGVNG